MLRILMLATWEKSRTYKVEMSQRVLSSNTAKMLLKMSSHRQMQIMIIASGGQSEEQ